MRRVARDRPNRATSPVFSRSCGVAAVLAGALFAGWGYVHGRLASSLYLDAATAALSIGVPTLFLVGLAGLHTRYEGTVSRLGETGFILGFVGSAVGSVRGVENLIGWYDAHVLGYTNSTAKGLLLHPWIDWTTLLFAGLSLVGIATARTKTLGALRAWPLATGAFGWAYLFTDSGGAAEMRLGHVAFGLLFSLSWVTLGGVLWHQGARRTITTRLG